jgi:hypothetical protein
MIHSRLIQADHRRWIASAAFLLATLALAACGGDDDGTTDGGGVTPEASTDSSGKDSGTDTRPNPDDAALDSAVPSDVTRTDGGTDAGAANDGRPGADASIDAAIDVRADISNDATPDANQDDVNADQTSSDANGQDTTPEGGPAPDGALDGSDGARPTIDQDCRDCMVAKLGAGGAPDGCDALNGNATAGPAEGTPLRQLCRETLDCFHRTNCHLNAVYECYCGTAIDQGTCFTSMDIPMPGGCKTELDRSLEVPAGSAGSVALGRLVDPVHAGGVAGIAGTFEDTMAPDGCYEVCIPYTPTQ